MYLIFSTVGGYALFTFTVAAVGWFARWARKPIVKRVTAPAPATYVSPFLLPGELPFDVTTSEFDHDWREWRNARERYALTPTAEHSDACTARGQRYLDSNACRACWYDAMLRHVTPANPPDRPITR